MSSLPTRPGKGNKGFRDKGFGKGRNILVTWVQGQSVKRCNAEGVAALQSYMAMTYDGDRPLDSTYPIRAWTEFVRWFHTRMVSESIRS